MKLAIINGSARLDNTTMQVSTALRRVAESKGWEPDIAGIAAFDTVLRDEYITWRNASSAQRRELNIIRSAGYLLFVVPTYFKSMPGALKNFFDVVRIPELYDRKRIGVIASNHKNQDYGARHAEEVIKGITIFFDIAAIIVPEILILNPMEIDGHEAQRWIDRLERYPEFSTQ
jgi:NAD(P)H-dependent FMN reductase